MHGSQKWLTNHCNLHLVTSAAEPDQKDFLILLAKNTLCQVLSKEADHLESLVLFAVAVNIHLNRHSAHTLNNFHHLVFVESNSVHVLIDLYGHMLSDNAVFTMFQSL